MKPHEDEFNSLLDLPCDSEAAIRERLLAIVSYRGHAAHEKMRPEGSL
jgi:hypothetical protein